METVTILKAGGMSIGGAGVIGATGYGAYTLIQPTTIKEKLEQEGLELIDSGDTDTWKTMAQKYPNKGTDNTKKFPDTDSISGSTDNEKGTNLKNKCESTLGIKLNSEEYSEVKENAARAWCIKEKATVVASKAS